MSDERPTSTEEAAEIVRNDPALSVATHDTDADDDDREPEAEPTENDDNP
jgi:hypothetical protein